MQRLVTMSREGMRLASIALRLGRSYDSTRHMARNLGVDLPAIRRRPAPGVDS